MEHPLKPRMTDPQKTKVPTAKTPPPWVSIDPPRSATRPGAAANLDIFPFERPKSQATLAWVGPRRCQGGRILEDLRVCVCVSVVYNILYK